MSFLRSLALRSDVENPLRPLTDTTLLSILGGAPTKAGIAVTPKSSLAMSAVYRSTAVISGVSAALPLKAYRKGTRDQAQSPLLDDPHPDMTPLELWRLSYVWRCLYGNFYAQKVRDRGGQPKWLYPIHPEKVKVGRVPYSDDVPAGKIFQVTDEDGEQHVRTSDQIFHLPAMGYDGLTGASPIRAAQQAIGLALAAEEYGARLFANGALMAGILQTEQRLTQDQAEGLMARWRSKIAGLGKAHEAVILDNGAKWQSLTMPNRDAQFLESRRFEISEIGRFFGVPPFLLGETEKSTSWGTGLEQQLLGWIMLDLQPQWLSPTEQRITKELTGTGVDAKYSVQGLMRGDSAARAAYYRVMREVGALNADEIRALEDRPPIPGGKGQTYLQPANLEPLGTEEPATPAPPPDDEDDDQEDEA